MRSAASSVDYCGVCDGHCLNPAGYQVGGLGGPIGDNPDPPRTKVECSWCGHKCCARCRIKVGGKWYCLHDAERVDLNPERLYR